MKRPRVVGDGNMQLYDGLPSLSIQRSTCKDWKFDMPPNKSIARKIFKGENMCSFRYFLDFSTKASWITPPLQVHNASQISFNNFFKQNFG